MGLAVAGVRVSEAVSDTPTPLTSGLLTEAEVVGDSDIGPLESVSDCNFNLDLPHNSGHVPGNVTSNAVINCNSAKKYLGVETYLYREVNPECFQLVADNFAANNSGNGSCINAAAALGCVSARYLAKAEFLTVEANDARHERSHTTQAVRVNCWAPGPRPDTSL